jgi:spoIIIJ-associated protein
MNERANVEKIAPTVEEAIAEGLAELGLTEESVDVEVLDGGSRGLLGLGGRQARVRLSVKQSPAETPVSPRVEVESITLARGIVIEMLEKMGVTASVEAHLGEPDDQGETPLMVDITGADLGMLIGRHAEILNAMQYLVNQMLSRKLERWVQVVIDVEGYRARRETQLRQLARRMAEQAVKTGRRQNLEPMSASDRRDHQEVTTQSVGEEPTRKVTVIPKK